MPILLGASQLHRTQQATIYACVANTSGIPDDPGPAHLVRRRLPLTEMPRSVIPLILHMSRPQREKNLLVIARKNHGDTVQVGVGVVGRRMVVSLDVPQASARRGQVRIRFAHQNLGML